MRPPLFGFSTFAKRTSSPSADREPLGQLRRLQEGQQAGDHQRQHGVGASLKALAPRLRGFAPLGALTVLAASLGCESGGVGDPCIPEDEFSATFSGFVLGEVSVESRSVQCETRVCLVNKFQGRVSCPYGTNGPTPSGEPTVGHTEQCEIPGIGGPVRVPVEAQRTERLAEVAVYCSCRCSGDDPNARYCECPNGFECSEVVVDQGQGRVELAGGYCIRSGTDVDDTGSVAPDECDLAAVDCGPTGG